MHVAVAPFLSQEAQQLLLLRLLVVPVLELVQPVLEAFALAPAAAAAAAASFVAAVVAAASPPQASAQALLPCFSPVAQLLRADAVAVSFRLKSLHPLQCDIARQGLKMSGAWRGNAMCKHESLPEPGGRSS